MQTLSPKAPTSPLKKTHSINEYAQNIVIDYTLQTITDTLPATVTIYVDSILNFVRKRSKNALLIVDKLLETHKDNPWVMCYGAITYHHFGKNQKALTLLLNASNRFPDNLLIRSLLSLLFALSTQPWAVTIALGHNLNLNELLPHRSEFYAIEIIYWAYALGNHFARSGQFSQAEACIALMKEISADNPLNEDLSNTLNDWYRLENPYYRNFAQLTDLSESLSSTIDHYTIEPYAINIAVNHHGHLISLMPEPIRKQILYLVDNAEENPEIARWAALQFLKHYPDNPLIISFAIDHCVLAKDFTQALNLINQAHERFPHDIMIDASYYALNLFHAKRSAQEATTFIGNHVRIHENINHNQPYSAYEIGLWAKIMIIYLRNTLQFEAAKKMAHFYYEIVGNRELRDDMINTIDREEMLTSTLFNTIPETLSTKSI